MSLRLLPLALFGLLSAACPGTVDAPVDAGAAADGGTADTPDAGAPAMDAGARADAGRVDAGALPDGGSPSFDAGPLDSGLLTDAGAVVPDAGSLIDAGPAASDGGAVQPDAGALDGGGGGECLPRFLSGTHCPDFDAELADLARRNDRAFHAIAAAPYGASTEVAITDPEARTRFESFINESDGWDYEAHSGIALADDVVQWQKTAGLYSGVGIATDAYRYGVLRDEGAPVVEVDRARTQLIAGLEALHLAKTIPGTPGVIARGFVRTDIASLNYETVPLFDGNGDPLPAEKDNGTWRADNSGGLYPNTIWEDSCSRDQYLGWVAAYGAAWEVIQDDDSIDQLYRDRLQTEAKDLGDALMVVADVFGHDLEIPDADGRTTYHGYLHEEAYDRTYIPFLPVKNAANALMAVGIVATLAWVSDDDALGAYLSDVLIADRDLPGIIEDDMVVDFGNESNFSSYNMVFMGALLAGRTLDDADARAHIRNAVHDDMYANETAILQPTASGWGHSLYDFVYAATMADGSVFSGAGGLPLDQAALGRGLDTLHAMDVTPRWNDALINCDSDEVDALSCLAVDGVTTIVLRDGEDRFGNPMALEPVPWRLRPGSNYEWRSSPFRVNGNGSPIMMSGVDFRYPYWLGRWLPK